MNYLFSIDASLGRIVRYLIFGICLVLLGQLVNDIPLYMWVTGAVILFEVSFLCLKPNLVLFGNSIKYLFIAAVFTAVLLFYAPVMLIPMYWNDVQAINPHPWGVIDTSFFYSTMYVKLIISVAYILAAGLRINYYQKYHA